MHLHKCQHVPNVGIFSLTCHVTSSVTTMSTKLGFLKKKCRAITSGFNFEDESGSFGDGRARSKYPPPPSQSRYAGNSPVSRVTQEISQSVVLCRKYPSQSCYAGNTPISRVMQEIPQSVVLCRKYPRQSCYAGNTPIRHRWKETVLLEQGFITELALAVL